MRWSHFSFFLYHLLSVVVGRRSRRAGATSAFSLTSSSLLEVVRHWICGLINRHIGCSYRHYDCHGQALYQHRWSHFDRFDFTSSLLIIIIILSRSHDTGSAILSVGAGLASWSSSHFLSSSFRHIDSFQARQTSHTLAALAWEPIAGAGSRRRGLHRKERCHL